MAHKFDWIFKKEKTEHLNNLEKKKDSIEAEFELRAKELDMRAVRLKHERAKQILQSGDSGQAHDFLRSEALGKSRC